MKNLRIIGVIVVIIGSAWWYINLDYGSFLKGNTGTFKNLTELPESVVEKVKPTEVVELKDGDTYDMEATIVSQEVGNRTIKRLAYNGQIPGPILKVQKGSKVTVNFTNNIDMETALHSHGLRGDWRFDGATPITPAIPVGESFAYELVFPDTGVFWYHPHVREDYQQEMGLYGNFIVEEVEYWNDVDKEAYVIIDDILEDGDFADDVVTNTLMGRFGDTLLINDSENYNLTVKVGEITRVFVTNVANTRTFQIGFDGALTKLVGGDIGRIENETFIKHQIIGPAERYIFELYYDKPGIYTINHRGKVMGTVTVNASDFNRKTEFMSLRSNLSDYSKIRNVVATLVAKTPDKNLRLDIEMKGMMGRMMNNNEGVDEVMIREHCQMTTQMTGCEPYLEEGEEAGNNEDGIEWEDEMAMMNQMSSDHNIEWVIEDIDTQKRNHKIDWSFKQGDLVKARIYNDENGVHPMQHPIHFHGQRFVVLTRDGKISENLQWKDTVLIPKGQTVDILVDMSNSGKWMAHCHIAEHLHSGMMFNFDVN